VASRDMINNGAILDLRNTQFSLTQAQTPQSERPLYNKQR
jgi:hypothetical protein